MDDTCSAFDTVDTPDPRRDASPARSRRARNGCVAQLFVFDGDDYLGWDCFEKDTVFVGSGPEVDLELDAPGLDGMQAVIHFDGRRVVVHDPTGDGRVRVNDEPVRTCVLGTLDVVGIGRYSLKVRIKRIRRDGDPPAEPARQHRPRPAPAATDAAGPEHREETPPAPIQLTPPPDDRVDPEPERTPGPGPWPEPAGSVAPVEEAPRQPAPLPARLRPLSDTVPTDEAHRLSESPDALPAEVVENAPLWDTLDTSEAMQLFEVLVDEVICDDPPPAARPQEAMDAELWEATAVVVDLEQRRREDRREEPTPEEPTDRLEPLFAAVPVPEEDDEEDEPDRPADFTLAERLFSHEPAAAVGAVAVSVVEVARFRDQELVDVRFLQPGESYSRLTRDGDLPVARRERDGSCRVFCDRDRLRGTVTRANGAPVHTDTFGSPESRADRKGERFQLTLEDGAQVALGTGHDTYLVRWTTWTPGPEVAVPSPSRRGTLKNLLASGLLHVLLICAGGLFVSLPDPTEPPPPESRFVQIDTRELETLTQPKPKPRPAPPPKKESVRPIRRENPPPKSAKPPKPKRSSRPKPTERTAPDSVARAGKHDASSPAGSSAHPDAGGGHGGNAVNRDLKQEGILGALGIPRGTGVGAKQAMAAVTNLDAGATAHASEAALKVGGIAGKLGNSTIALPKMGLVNTKGTTQVVASAGVGGEGTVAALARGKTGKGQVMGLVSADLKAPVQIQGGMTREEVKKVIDRHMDEITYCYETALIDDPALVGKMTFEWRILKTGQVGEVRIQASSIRSDSLHACIQRSIKTWDFPRPRGGAEVLVSYPFIFDVVGF